MTIQTVCLNDVDFAIAVVAVFAGTDVAITYAIAESN